MVGAGFWDLGGGVTLNIIYSNIITLNTIILNAVIYSYIEHLPHSKHTPTSPVAHVWQPRRIQSSRFALALRGGSRLRLDSPKTVATQNAASRGSWRVGGSPPPPPHTPRFASETRPEATQDSELALRARVAGRVSPSARLAKNSARPDIVYL